MSVKQDFSVSWRSFKCCVYLQSCYILYYFPESKETPKGTEIIRQRLGLQNADLADPAGLLQSKMNYAEVTPQASELKCPVVIHRGIIHGASIWI